MRWLYHVILVAILPDVWRCGVGVGTGWPGVKMLRLGIDGRHDLRLLSVRLHEHLSKQIRDRLVGLVVKASTSRAEDPWLDSRLRYGDFSGSSHTSDLKIGTPVATLPGA